MLSTKVSAFSVTDSLSVFTGYMVKKLGEIHETCSQAEAQACPHKAECSQQATKPRSGEEASVEVRIQEAVSGGNR